MRTNIGAFHRIIVYPLWAIWIFPEITDFKLIDRPLMILKMLTVLVFIFVDINPHEVGSK